jgi:hypothetical protein
MEIDKKELTKYYSSIGEEFKSKIDRISYLIGREHYPSSGKYRERILIQVISKFLPKRYSIGTGFVLFPSIKPQLNDQSLKILNHQISKELDIIIYDSNDYSTIYQDNDFIIVKPESVRVIIEVKSTLNPKNSKTSAQGFIDFACKWYQFEKNWRCSRTETLHLPGLFIMSWTIYLNKAGKRTILPKTVAKNIVNEYKKEITIPCLMDPNFPLISALLIYNEAIVYATNALRPYSGIDVGYGVMTGKFDYIDPSYTFYNEDKTISYLISCIDSFLNGSDNSKYTSPDRLIFPSIADRDYEILFSLSDEGQILED